MSKFRSLLRNNRQTLSKTASYYVIHVTVAAMVAYAVTGNLIASLTLSLLERTEQAFALFFHEKAWQRWNVRKQAASNEAGLSNAA